MLEGSRTLIGKMLATQLLRRRHQLIAELIAIHPKVARIHAAKISEALPELSTQASSMREVLETELVIGFNSLTRGAISGLGLMSDDQPGRDSPRPDLQLMEFLVAPFFKPIATSNETSKWYLAWIRVDNARREGGPPSTEISSRS